MSILKIRDENGNIHSIATMKGDKGDGVPDGGNAGQVVKKTEEGVEWGDVTSACTAIFTNTDIAANSCPITKRGLYEVKIFCSVANTSNAPSAESYTKACKCLMSISDLNEAQSQSLTVINRAAYISYENKTFTSSYTHGVGDTIYSGNRSYLAEVRLIIPYD